MKYVKVTKTTPNPVFDGRCKYGEQAVKEFREGQVLVLRENSGMRDRVSRLGKNDHIFQDDLPPLSEWTEPTEPTDWQRYRNEITTHAESDCYILEQLVKLGKVTFEDLREADDASIAEYQAGAKG